MEIQGIVEKLRRQRYRYSTKKNYYAIWRSFNQFIVHLDIKPLAWEDRLPLYIAYLIENRRRSATICSYVLAIRAILKENDIIMNKNQFLIASLTCACKLQNDQLKVRLPIRKSLLQVLMNKTKDYFNSRQQPYLACLYSTIFSTAYYGLFRVGEIAMSQHVIKAVDVHIADNKRKLLFILRSSKTLNKGAKPQMVKISAITINESQRAIRVMDELQISCPYQQLRHYLALRHSITNKAEQFFVFRHGIPVTARHISTILKKILKISGFDDTLYSTHSFCVGCCCDFLQMGISVETIKKLGRWKSNVVLDYLRDI